MKYKCGHKSKPIIMDNNPLSISAYLEWKETAGFEGDKSKCFDCWTKNSLESSAKDEDTEEKQGNE